MDENETVSSQIYIKVAGKELAPELRDVLIEAIIYQNVHLPCAFILRFYDKELDLLDKGIFDPTRQVEISAENDEGKRTLLVKGEITALEPEFGEGMIAELVVRGYDNSHRLFRETKTRAFLNVKDSDLATQFAREAGLKARVDPTPTVYDHLFQANQSDLAFLMERAWRIGYECFVSEGSLYFRKPPKGGPTIKLAWGEDLLSFKPRLNLAEQVNQVTVKGWDCETQKPLVGQAKKGRLSPKVKEKKDGASWAQPFGKGELTIVDQPVISQAEANLLAAARMDEISGAFIEADGEVFRRPDVCAGGTVEIEGLGKRFSGCYQVTAATHRYARNGLHTDFAVRGVRTGLLLDEMDHQAPLDRRTSLVVGVVTNTNDPQKRGRVCLKFPWMSEKAESCWARVIGPGAGPEAGFFAVPEVGDEVLVAFLHGDINQPCVIGGLWNGKNPIPPEGAQAAPDQRPQVRVWRSRSGHRIVFHDDQTKKIEVISAAGRKIVLDDRDKKILLENEQVKVTIEKNKIRIEAANEIEITSKGGLKLDARGNIEIKASGQVNIKGQMINLN